MEDNKNNVGKKKSFFERPAFWIVLFVVIIICIAFKMSENYEKNTILGSALAGNLDNIQNTASEDVEAKTNQNNSTSKQTPTEQTITKNNSTTNQNNKQQDNNNQTENKVTTQSSTQNNNEEKKQPTAQTQKEDTSSTVTLGEKNALSKSKSYLSIMAFAKNALK